METVAHFTVQRLQLEADLLSGLRAGHELLDSAATPLERARWARDQASKLREHEGILDGLSALERVRATSSLRKKVGELRAGGLSVLDRLRVTRDVRMLVDMLGGVLGDEDGLSDDPNAPNYRYADTGYIADSRKERAEGQIRAAREAGQLVQATAIDWDAVERNPRAAAELIVKSNLFGQVEWSALGAAGMDPAAGFLIDRVYASIAPAPQDDPQVRKDYAVALTTIRARLEVARTVKGVRDVLEEILEETEGANLNELEAEQYAALREKIEVLKRQILEAEEPTQQVQAEAELARKVFSDADWALTKRKRRGWKVEEAHLQEVAEARARNDVAMKRYAEAMAERRAKVEPLRDEIRSIQEQTSQITRTAIARNVQSPLARGWISFGPKFLAVLKYRYTKSGSAAFLGHVVNAEAGKIPDWSWAEKERVVTRGPSKREVSFQLLVADSFERVGGRPSKIESTAALKTSFGLREVQSGNWVLKDPNSARFHVEQAGAAFSDLADVIGIDAAHLGLGGRLGMAFGARGSGGKQAPRAHYEPVHRVVNLTKMGGGGALGHELFHAFDNILPSLATGTAGSKGDFATRSPELLPDGPLRSAFAELRAAIMTGDHRSPQAFAVSDRDRERAKVNIDGFYSNSIGRAIKAAGSGAAAVLAVDRLLGDHTTKRGAKNHRDWRQIAAAYYAPAGEDLISLETGPARSSFATEGVRLDDGEDGKYWSEDVELAARAFQAWVEDSLEGQGRRNDYLSAFAHNKHYREGKPFPEGEERARINAAFDKLFAALRESKVFEAASMNKPLLDAIFGDGSPGVHAAGEPTPEDGQPA